MQIIRIYVESITLEFRKLSHLIGTPKRYMYIRSVPLEVEVPHHHSETHLDINR